MSLRDSELHRKVADATYALREVMQEYEQRGGKKKSPDWLAWKAARRAHHSAELLRDRLEKMAEITDPCPECGQRTLTYTGESCEQAVGSFGVVDYYGDGSHYVPEGVHGYGVWCTNDECGFVDAEPCVHD